MYRGENIKEIGCCSDREEARLEAKEAKRQTIILEAHKVIDICFS